MSSPVFSTTQGATCVYVSDLWVSPEMRGQGVGQALLAAAAREGAARWGARAVRLTVYHDNDAAMAFYRKSGFALNDRDRTAALTGAPFAALTEDPV